MQDTLNEASLAAVTDLQTGRWAGVKTQKRAVQVTMLTGDNEASARHFSQVPQPPAAKMPPVQDAVSMCEVSHRVHRRGPLVCMPWTANELLPTLRRNVAVALVYQTMLPVLIGAGYRGCAGGAGAGRQAGGCPLAAVRCTARRPRCVGLICWSPAPMQPNSQPMSRHRQQAVLLLSGGCLVTTQDYCISPRISQAVTA
jgi:hypothetical protein